MEYLYYPALVVLGLGVGALGTLIGAGGGFVLVPVLVFLYPADQPETLASISLAVVFCNALSGSIAYFRQRAIDVRSGIRFAVAALPGAVFGAIVVGWLPRRVFEIVLGVALVGAALFLLIAKREPVDGAPPRAADRLGPRIPHNRSLGALISVGVGFVSSLLGLGGGIIHVPVLVHLLQFPVHVATATSHFVLAVTAGAGTITHVVTGAFHVGWRRTIALGIGVLIGAQLGAASARRTPPALILRALALALLLVGCRILIYAVHEVG